MAERSEMLANETIGKLLFKLSTPAMIGMIVQALYNLVDTIFIGRGVGVLGIAGVTIVFPIQMIIMSISLTIGIGGASIISRSLGAKNIQRAEKTMGNIISVVFVLSIIVMILGNIFIVPLLNLFGATDAILSYSKDYLRIILFGTVFFSFAMSSNNIVRAEGNAKVAMYTMLISAVLNIILDPIFIFSLNLGIKGAALASVIAQAVTAVYLLYYFLKGKSEMKIHIENLKPDFRLLSEIFAIGSASFFRNVAGSLMAIILNNLLSLYGGDVYIAVFGVVNRLIMFIFMPMFGIIQGMQPIVGFNYGAQRLDRVKQVLKISVLTTTIISTVGFLFLMIFPEFFISIFNSDVQLIEIGKKALRIIVLAFPLIGFQIVGASLFQAVGKAVPSLILSMSRQILFFIPLVLILPLFFKLNGIWFAFPIADFLSAIVTFIMFSKEIKLYNKTMV